MGMGAFIQSSKASAREVLFGSTSFMLLSILFVKSDSASRGKCHYHIMSASWPATDSHVTKPELMV